MKPAFVVAMAVLTCAAPASADWQNTKWGMKEAEVLALPGVSPLSPGDASGKRMPGANLFARIHSSYSIPDYQFDAIYMFNTSGQLAAVNLELVRGSPAALRGELMAKYGKPTENKGAVIFWNTETDKVMFSNIIGANVLYEPRVTANNKGL